jgi:hypothetical protein
MFMNGIKSEIIVLSANQYDMVDRETNRPITGTSIRYLFGSELKPVVDGSSKGYRLSKATLSFNSYNDLIEVPGIYDADIAFNVGSDGSTRVVLSNLIFKKSLISDKGGK